MSRKDFYIIGLISIIIVMFDMDVTPGEFAHLVQYTLPNYLKYKLNFV